MNVLFFTLSMSRKAGGLFFSVRSLAKSLQKSGAKCRVVGPEDEFYREDVPQWSPVETAAYPVTGPKQLGFSSQIRNLIGEPDIQHIHGIWMYQSRINRSSAKKRGTPYLISPRGMLDEWALRNSSLKKRLSAFIYEKSHLRDAACIHALCESEAASIRRYGLRNPICVIPNAVDLPVNVTPHHDGESPERIATEGGCCRKQLLFIGRIHPKKGLINLINAFGKLPAALRQEWEVVIAGWDQNHLHELKSLAENSGVANSVSFPGPAYGNEKEQLLKTADAFVLPSFSEGLPMSVLEAWSYGLPTLITSACNIPEGQQAGAAIQCEPDEQSILDGLSQLCSMDRADSDTMGNRARDLVMEKFTWPVVSEQMLEVYKWLLGDSPAPDTVRFD